MKIKSILIDSFRGIPNEIQFNFTDRKGNPQSTLIFGDNGSGKSSIIDAIEFNLQGKIERSDSLNNEFRPYPISINNYYEKEARTQIVFSNDEVFERDIIMRKDEKDFIKLHRSVEGFYSSFNIVPIVLRRSDIINYSITPTEKKQVLFWSFVYNTAQHSTNDSDLSNLNDRAIIQSLENQRIKLKKQRIDYLDSLAIVLNISKESIPFSQENKYLEFVKKVIRKGLTNKQIAELQFKGKLHGINLKAIEISQQILDLSDDIKKIQSEIFKLKKIENSNNVYDKKEQIRRFINNASHSLSASFKKIITIDFIEEVIISIGNFSEVSFEILVKLKNGQTISPNKIFSEANLDLLILLLFTSLIKESVKYGQSKLIILDDVLQSVDSTIRLNFIEYLLEEFSDWQIIITAHDRLWLNQLRSSFLRHHHSFKEFEIAHP